MALGTKNVNKCKYRAIWWAFPPLSLLGLTHPLNVTTPVFWKGCCDFSQDSVGRSVDILQRKVLLEGLNQSVGVSIIFFIQSFWLIFFLFIIIYLIEKDVYPFNLMMSDQEESMGRMLLKPFSPVVVATYTDNSHWKMACESEKTWEIIGGKCRIHFWWVILNPKIFHFIEKLFKFSAAFEIMTSWTTCSGLVLKRHMVLLQQFDMILWIRVHE